MSSSKPNPLERAKQGDPNAIAALLNRTLQPKGITASAEQENGFLHIILKAAQVPNQQAVVTFIHQGMTKLESDAIHTVRIDGYQNGQDHPAWSDEFNLEIAGLMPDELDMMPPIEEPSYDDLDSPGIDDEYAESAGIDDISDYESMEDGEDEEEAPSAKVKRPMNKSLMLGGIGALVIIAAVGAVLVLKPPIPGLFGNEAEETTEPAATQPTPAKPAAPAATGNKPATPVPAATPNKPATPAPAATANKPAAQSDPWREGVNSAIKAANLAQTASTQAQWNEVATQWQQAIDLMKKVPQSSPNYQAAQERVVSYQTNLNYAQQNAANSY